MAAHRLSRWAFFIANRKSPCASLVFDRHFHLRQLLTELVERKPDWTDGAEQITVVLKSTLDGDGRILCTDELPLSQTHAYACEQCSVSSCRSADRPAAGSALADLSELPAEQARVYRQCANWQAQRGCMRAPNLSLDGVP